MSTMTPAPKTAPAPPHPSAAVGLGVLAIAMWLVIGVVVGAAWLMTGERARPASSPTVGKAQSAADQDGPADASPGAGRPEHLEIDRVGIDTTLMDLDLTPDHELEVPPLSKPATAGWYDRSPVPGEVGPAVLAGHVDSKTGPAVFFRLHELRKGDRVVVDRSDGRTATFVVDRVDQVKKDAFPTKRVYGPTPRPELRLITCGGAFDASIGHYLSNVVVYAHLTSLTSA